MQTDGDERENLRVGDFPRAQGRIKGGGWLIGVRVETRRMGGDVDGKLRGQKRRKQKL